MTQISSPPNIILSLFERSWGEVDWIIPVLFELKSRKPDWKIVVVFSPDWEKFNPILNNHTLNNELNYIADHIVFFDGNSIIIPELVYSEQVKIILKDMTSYRPYNIIHKQFPNAKTVAHPHGGAVTMMQEYSRLRNLNYWDEYQYHHDVSLVTTESSISKYFNLIFNAKLSIVGFPRFDSWWIRRLLQSEHLLNSQEFQKSKLYKKTYLFIVRGPMREFPIYVFNYVIKSVAQEILSDNNNFLFIKPHPRQNINHLKSMFEGYNPKQWMISFLQVMQIAALSDFVISVNSSSILDGLAIGKPVVEFHPFFQPTEGMLIDSDGCLRSVFDLLNLSVYVRTREEFKSLIDDYFNENSNRFIWKNQQNNFRKLCPANDNASQRVADIIFNLVNDEINNNISKVYTGISPISGEKKFFIENDKFHFQLKRIKSYTLPINHILLHEIAQIFDTKIFISTETFNQFMAKSASKIFNETHFIETASDLYQPHKFSYLSDCSNINIYNSSNILKMLLPSIDKKVLFWLGSHEGSNFTFKNKTNTPIIEELKVIQKYGNNSSIIIINNLRFFQPVVITGFEAETSRKFPDIREAVDLIYKINPDYKILVLGDIAIAFPCSYIQNNQVTVSNGVNACTISRIYGNDETKMNQVIEAEHLISNGLSKQESLALKELYNDYYSLEETTFGAHYRLWNGLILFGEGYFVEAKNFFQKTIERGLDNWRIGWYLAQSAFKANDIPFAKNVANAVAKVVPEFKPVRLLLEQLNKL